MLRTFPYLEVSGTNRDVGMAIGEMFRGKIQEIIADRKHYIKKYSDHIESTRAYLKESEDAFPQYVEELRGMADGANVGFLDLFFHNTPEVYDHTLDWDREQAQTDGHCTIAVSFTGDDVIVGHNEDWSIESQDELFILKSTIGETTILCLSYASFLMGSAASMTSNGLVQCINELHQMSYPGVPKYFIARAVLDCPTLFDVEEMIRKTKRGSGYNHVLAQHRDVRDIELTGRSMDVEAVRDRPYVHTNHCISAHTIPFQITASESSLHRFDRATELVKNNMTIDDMKRLLSDTKDPKFPICRENHTIGSVVIECEKQTMHICYGTPDTGTFVPYRL